MTSNNSHVMFTSACAMWALVLCCSLPLGCQAFTPATSWSLSSSPTTTTVTATISTILQARRRRRDDYDEEDEFYDEDDDEFFDDDDDDDKLRRRRSRRDNLGEFQAGRQDRGMQVPSSFGRQKGWRLPESVSKALLAGVFVLGVGLGVTVDSAINTNPRDLASRDAIDQAAPNSGLCAKYGASAMAFDQRVFVSFNPFNVYVAQADVKPACVLRDANVVPILRDSKLITDNEVRACKQNMNTWAFVGDLKETPQLSCVYRSADAQNEFLSDPRIGIGEDYLDDDREALSAKLSTGKMVKDTLTQAQKDGLLKQQVINHAGK